jgi:type II secretory pathway component GspD/PulD (secretin)
MSLPHPAWVASSLVIVLGLASPAAPGQKADKRPASKPATAEPVARQVYAVRGGAAKDLADALTAHFQAEPSFRAVPDAGGNNLLLSGPKAALDDALAVLRAIDRPARTIYLEVLFVALASSDAKALDGVELAGPARDVTAKIRALQQQGVITSVKVVQLTTLERQVARSKVGESRPFVTGVVGFGGAGFAGRGAGAPAAGRGAGGGPTSQSITYREVGTSVQVTPDIGADGLVALDLRVEDAHTRAAEGGVTVGTDDKGTAVPATEFVIATVETRLKVRPGHMVLAEGTKVGSKTGQAQTVVLVTARTDEASPKDGK